jgi:hypothetical protein
LDLSFFESSWPLGAFKICFAGHLIYIFSALEAPKSMLKTIKNIQRKFLWQGTKEGRKWALVNWGDLCKPKTAGGLGLRDPHLLNQVMGAKIWWRWLKKPWDL